jgi:hypothetical protein
LTDIFRYYGICRDEEIRIDREDVGGEKESAGWEEKEDNEVNWVLSLILLNFEIIS